MAEAFAIVGIVSSIVQLVDFGSKVLARLHEYQPTLGEIPKSFRVVKRELPILIDTLDQAKFTAENDTLRQETKVALLPVIEGCLENIKALDGILHKNLPNVDDSWHEKSRKAFKSFRQDGKHTNTSPAANPIFYGPFERDPVFVDRDGLLSQIDELCSQPARRVVLVGLGGVGKSQLAIEYAYRVRDRLPETWVFWIHASNTARFEQSCRDITNVLKIPERENPKADVFKLIYDWLCKIEEKSQSQASEPDGGSFRPLWAYLLQTLQGSIIITSRSREAALKLIERNGIIPVEPMSEMHAAELFKKKLEPEVQRSDGDIAKLVAALEFMPLAIVQAAAYISQLAPRCSIQEYFERFHRSDRSKSNLLNYDGGHLRRDHEAKNSVITTWQISFEHIQQTRSSAADLLSLMSFFDSQGIPEALVRTQAQRGEGQDDTNDKEGDEDSHDDDSAAESEEHEFEIDVLTLRNYSFVSLSTDPHVFEMHKLVQLATREWLAANAQLERWKRQYIKNFDHEMPAGEYEDWTKCQQYFPHAQSAVAQRPEDEASLLHWASVLHKGAWYAYGRGYIATAEEMSAKAMKTRKNILTQDDRRILSSMSQVGSVYAMAGRWSEAEELRVEGMEASKRVLGSDHPDTLTSIGNLASTYDSQGRWNEAEKLRVQVLETRKRILGPDHPHTLSSIANLASTYSQQGRWNEAEELGVQVMETSQRVLGPDHPHTLSSIANLALTYSQQGRWNEAEELRLQVMETSQRVLGRTHPDTLIHISNLALTYGDQNRWKEAEELGTEALDMRKRVLGQDHPSTLISMSNLAFTFHSIGKEDDATTLMEDCLRRRKVILGSDHPSTKLSEDTLNEWRMERLRLDDDWEPSHAPLGNWAGILAYNCGRDSAPWPSATFV
ncbi:MAG: hypothetical protein M1821_005193 [Bathelium mastoideum]|nr:MAG: hypothetical protein M1821_005193 [Bathelium mastoideum]